MKSLLTIVILSLLMGLPFGLALSQNTANAHNTGYNKHTIAQEFHSHYDAQYDVYCGWRHAFEGMSCVKVGFLSTLIVGD